MVLLRPRNLSQHFYENNRSQQHPVDVLIADDELVVRRVLEMALRSAGLRVATAADGADVVRLYQQHEGNVGLILLDIHMPEMDGPQAFATLRQIAPDVRVVFMSGGSADYSVEELLASGAIGFVQKPFRDLDDVVNRLCNLVTSAAHAG